MRARYVRYYTCPSCLQSTRTELALWTETLRTITMRCAHCELEITVIKLAYSTEQVTNGEV